LRNIIEIIKIRSILTFLLLISVTPLYAGESGKVVSELDPTMKYYLDNTDKVFRDKYIFKTNARFSFEVRSIYQKTDYRGETQEIDTAIYKIFFTGDVRDSLTVLDSAGLTENIFPDMIELIEPWKGGYNFYFFPRDTGSGRLAIGFSETGETGPGQATGFFNINRDNFYLEDMIYHNPTPDNSYRLSLRYGFGRMGDYLIPGKYIIQIIKKDFFGWRYFSHSLEFMKIQIDSN